MIWNTSDWHDRLNMVTSVEIKQPYSVVSQSHVVGLHHGHKTAVQVLFPYEVESGHRPVCGSNANSLAV